MANIEHPDITKAMETGYPKDMEGNPITVCANPNCEEPIYKGEEVWKKGSDLFCHLTCLVETMRNQEE